MPQSAIGNKKPHPCRVRHDPLNMFYNMRNPPGCFRRPVKACRPQSQIGSIDRFTTVQGFAANHEQGRVNHSVASKELRDVIRSRFLRITSSQTGISSRKKFGKKFGCALDKCKTGHPKKRMRQDTNFKLALAGHLGLCSRLILVGTARCAVRSPPRGNSTSV
jgi:hypothetical protein